LPKVRQFLQRPSSKRIWLRSEKYLIVSFVFSAINEIVRTVRALSMNLAPGFVLVTAVCFNAILAILNGHFVALARAHVIFAEIAVYAGALAMIVSRADRRMWPWFLLTIFIILMGLFVSAGSGELNAKYIRDVLVIPIFIMLGMTYQSNTFVKPFSILHTIILLVAIIEVASPDTYAEVFKILDYYVNTRDFSANSFWNTESTLFVSATRPGSRFFGFVDWHRVSSIFLEPVSLGNYCVIAAIILVACWHEMSVATRSYFIGSTFFLLVGCDGRLAAVSTVIVYFAVIFVRNISSRWSVFYLPIILILSTVSVWALGSGGGSDDFAGRVAGTIDALSRVDVHGLLGLNAGAAENAVDNGIVYFILSQSLIGVTVIWFTVCLCAPGRTSQSRIYVHAIAIFVPLNLMVSYSFFSIKVASLVWFFYGYLYIRDLNAVDPATEAEYSADRRAVSSAVRPIA
jgi:putative polymerase